MKREELLKCSKRGGASRSDIALHYFPSTSAKASVAKMRRWISGDREFRKALRLTGYSKGCHRFFPGTIRVFISFFGLEAM